MLSIDLRKRIVETYLEGEESLRKIAERFKVSFSSVYRFWTKYKQSGNVEALPHTGGKTYKITEEQFEEIVEVLEVKNDLTQQELVQICEDKLGIKVSQPTISRRLAQLEISRKKNFLPSKKRFR